jgi:hypothetical protein
MALARNTDPETSHKAKVFRFNEDRVLVLEIHNQHRLGLTDYDLAAITGRQQNSVGKRRTELRDQGFIEDSGMRRKAPSKAMCIVWRITPTGISIAGMLSGKKEEAA